MGQFSWFTQDTGEQIFNDCDIYPDDKQTIHMVNPIDGTDYVESNYEGYGIFGGMDFYVLLSFLNKDIIKKYYYNTSEKEILFNKLYDKNIDELTDKDKSLIRLDGIHIEDKHDKMLFPILVKNYDKWKNYIGLKPDWDPNQGWHIMEETDEDE